MLAVGPEPRRWRALAALAALTLALHLALLGGVEFSPPRLAVERAPSVQVRTLQAPTPAVVEPPPPAPALAAAPAPRPITPPRRPAAVAVPAPPPEPVPEVEAPEPLKNPREPTVEGAASAAVPMAPAAPAPAEAVASEAEGAPPLYATRPPPPVTLRYELRRGRLSGSGDLFWRPDGERYTLRLEGSVVGLNVLTQESTGTLEANGLVPLRFTDQRARRPMVAANFEREAGRIRFSGPSTELPWQPGVQDRLSWMIQLAAVAEAEPQRLAAGERIVMQVVGARGDASAWAFRSLGPEPLTMFGERRETMHLLREPRHPYDTRVEVWLDPARRHLPVRATLGSGDEDLLELRLRELVP
jgi:hypothetical protein